jgi:anthranilate synthase component 2
MTAPSVLFIDNFDSFTFNLVHDLRSRGCAVEVWRNDLAVEEAERLAVSLPRPSLVVLSPGPGCPADAGCTVPLVRALGGRVPVFGVCLGHQAIVEAFGGEVGPAGEVCHGKAAPVTHDGTGIFAGLPSPIRAGRYHSLAALSVPDDLRVSARCGDLVMAVEHVSRPVAGVQFHPESVLTPEGGGIVDNVLAWAIRRSDEVPG